MPPTPRRLGLVLALFLLAGLAGTVVQAGPRPAPPLPAVAPLLAGTGWRVAVAYQPGWQLGYRQWGLRDAAGRTALLYLGVTGAAKQMLHWSGELGYQGEGYLVQRRGVARLALPGGGGATVDVATLGRLGERLLVASAVVSPDGIAARGTDDLLRTGWEVLRGTAGPYYLVRLSVSERSGEAAAQAVVAGLFPPVLAALQQQARALVS
jgi:hypothetical protein